MPHTERRPNDRFTSVGNGDSSILMKRKGLSLQLAGRRRMTFWLGLD
jgi:hypothetical protein